MVYIYVLKLQKNKYYVGKTTDPKFRLETHLTSGGSWFTRKFKPIQVHEVRPDCTDHDEQRITQEYMVKYGIHNVRGGPWTQIVLSDAQEEFIQNILDSENDKCYQCGEIGHFISNCPQKSQKVPKTTAPDTPSLSAYMDMASEKLHLCERCGRSGHKTDDCYAKTDSQGDPLGEDCSCQFCGKTFETKKGCSFHENIHCPKRRVRGSKKSTGDMWRNICESSEESSDEEVICYRCGRSGHYATTCYAAKHRKGYYL